MNAVIRGDMFLETGGCPAESIVHVLSCPSNRRTTYAVVQWGALISSGENGILFGAIAHSTSTRNYVCRPQIAQIAYSAPYRLELKDGLRFGAWLLDVAKRGQRKWWVLGALDAVL